MPPAVQYAEAEVLDRPPVAVTAVDIALAGRLAAARGVIEGKFLDLGVTLEKSVEVVQAA